MGSMDAQNDGEDMDVRKETSAPRHQALVTAEGGCLARRF